MLLWNDTNALALYKVTYKYGYCRFVLGIKKFNTAVQINVEGLFRILRTFL